MSRGIVRHIDALGRVVIPRELRRSLRIRENDPVEIEGTDNGLILRKVSALNGLDFFAARTAECLAARLEGSVLAADQAHIVAAPGRPELIGQTLTESLRAVEKTLFREEGAPFALTEEGLSVSALAAVPVRRLGERFGFLILTGEGRPVKKEDLPLLEFAADLLAGLLGEE